MKKYSSIILITVLMVFCLCACSNKGNNNFISNFLSSKSDGNSTDKKLHIVTTIFPEYDWVKEILGDRIENAEITMLLDNGVDLHSYQPTAEDLLKISNCDLFIYVGGESDKWVEDALQQSTNKNRKVINLLDVLGDTVKEEEVVEGMEDEHEHSHGTSQFEDSDVKDRSLSDWEGEWQSVYPYLLSGDLDKVMEHKAEENDNMTAKEYYNYYKTGYETDVERIIIDGKTIKFIKNGVSTKAKYQYKGYKIYTYESGNRGVRYFFEAVENKSGAPKYVQFSDHGIAPTNAEHFHIYFGNDGFEALSKEMENWPTYYPDKMNGKEIAEEMIGHDQEETEYDEHVWLSLKNAPILCSAIADALAEIDQDNASTYQKNVVAYNKKLSELDKNYQSVVNNTKQKTLLFGDRFPFRYLVEDYGLSYYAAFVGCSAETEASFKTITFLANKIDELALNTVFTIEKSDQKIAKTIIENTKRKDQKILVLNSMQSITSKDVSKGATYLSIMEQNLDVLKAALK